MQHQGNDLPCKLEQLLKGMAASYTSTAFQNETPSVSFKSLLHWISHDRAEKNQSLLRVLQTHLLPGKPTILGACVLVHISIRYQRARSRISHLSEQSEILQHSYVLWIPWNVKKRNIQVKSIFFFSFNAFARGWHYITENFITVILKNNNQKYFLYNISFSIHSF